MVGLLSVIADTMAENNIPYEYEEWTQDISYPYFVGIYDETGFIYEDNHTSGAVTIYGWSRDSRLVLAEYADKIRSLFSNVQVIADDCLYFIRYGGSLNEPTDVEGLSKVSITLYVEEWKGEE
ncbi:MAG: hypothetical protein LUF04_02005 [Bacteroides sp.]|nr:hypothetical protein [Bacteroides sp.]